MVSRALAIAILLGIGVARADSPKLDEARHALEAARFAEAQQLLAGALEGGGNSLAAVRQIYELSGEVAIALNQREVAEQFYRRWLAIDPAAKLADGVAPKLEEAFASARAYIAAHGRLAATTEWVRVPPKPAALHVVVQSDPLNMARAAIIAGGTAVPFGAGPRAEIPIASSPGTELRVAVLDERGNRLLELDAITVPSHVLPYGDPPSAFESQRPFAKRWTTWAVPSAAFLIGGSILGMLALQQQRELDDALESSGDHFFTEIDSKHRLIRRNATIGIALGAASALLAIPAAVFYVRSGRSLNLDRLVVIPVVDPIDGGGSVVATGRF